MRKVNKDRNNFFSDSVNSRIFLFVIIQTLLILNMLTYLSIITFTQFARNVLETHRVEITENYCDVVLIWKNIFKMSEIVSEGEKGTLNQNVSISLGLRRVHYLKNNTFSNSKYNTSKIWQKMHSYLQGNMSQGSSTFLISDFALITFIYCHCLIK